MRTVEEIIGREEAEEAVLLQAPLGKAGNVTERELAILAKLVRHFQPEALFEIGTFDGRTTLNLAAHAPGEARVYTLDLPRAELSRASMELLPAEKSFVDKEASGTRFQGTSFAGRIQQLYGDSATFDYSSYQGGIDFIFIDGSHAYDYVLKDTETARKLLRNGKGVIVWHDYGVWDPVTEALDEIAANCPIFRIEETSLAIWIQ